jgi:uncharacterized protein with GYD domain
METYVVLGRLTEKATANLKDPALIEDSFKASEEVGGELKGFYVTMGRYDFVAIWEFPDDDAMMKATLRVGATGAVRTETLKAISWDKVKKMIQKV